MKMLEKQYPVDAKDYKLYEEVGEGVSAIVHRALCIPFNEIVAIKVLDLERCSNDLDGIRREVHTMSLIDHPNVLRAHCSFTEGHNLWIVMPYMAGGSCLHIMKSAYPDGFEEPVIATLLRETLKGLVYLHTQGHIHRDVKAGNILLDTNGTVKLADFGVSACMFDMGDRQRSRNTFVGTPCWMAPEVMQQLHGYDFRADIWSFGITALELAHGHAPFSKYPPMKVLLMTLQNAPPGLDYERDKRFSKSFKEMVAACLVKDPKKRPTSEKLLKHKFFKHAKSNEYLAHILDGLPPLGERYRMLKARDADLFLQNKALNGDKEHKSLQEYIRGISAWNFNLEDLKRPASLIHDDDNILHSENPNMNGQKDTHDTIAVPVYKSSPKSTNRSNAADSHEDGLDDVDNVVGSLASFPIKPLQALKGCFDTDENDVDARTTTWKNAGPSDAEVQSPENKTETAWSTGEKNLIRSSSLPQFVMGGPKAVRSGPLLPEDVRSSKKHTDNGDRECLEARYPWDRNYSGPIFHRQKRDMNNHARVEDSPDGAAVQRKGRFQVTSADMSPKGLTNNSLSHSPGSAAGITPLNPAAASVLPSLHRLLQHINMQQEEIIKLIKSLEQNSDNLAETDAISNGASQISRISARQEQLLAKVNQLQQRVGSLVEELQRQKLKNAQLERELNALLKKDEHSTD